MVKNLPAVWETQVRSLGWEDPLDDPLQYSCLENSMGRGAWWATVHGVTKESDMTERLDTTTTTLGYGGVFIKGTLWKGRREQHVGWRQRLQ